ncbi:hypothetical protein VTP01DRAFT_6438 [Rhizomucor pusillus]|uniref:uncharacterized protein n=1 Tax=Rhizomucor pusillus TaxID=4840 RepID=UPI00374220AE
MIKLHDAGFYQYSSTFFPLCVTAAADEDQHKTEHQLRTSAYVSNGGGKGRQEQHNLEKAQEAMLKPIIENIKPIKESKDPLMKVKHLSRDILANAGYKVTYLRHRCWNGIRETHGHYLISLSGVISRGKQQNETVQYDLMTHQFSR